MMLHHSSRKVAHISSNIKNFIILLEENKTQTTYRE